MHRKPIYPEPSAQGSHVEGPPVPPPSYEAAMGQHPAPPGPQPYVLPPIQPTPVIIIPTVNLGSKPARVTCPQCQNNVVTRVEYVPGTSTHIFAILLLLFGCFPCACLPYCIDSCQNANHYCPICGTFIGVHKGE